MKVLIVDDEEIARTLLRHVLEQEGHEVHEAGDGLGALEILKEKECRLVVTDWEMPRMNGLELCRAIRRHVMGRYVYTILLTHHGHPDDIVSGLNAGADDFITKPFNPPELIARVRTGVRVLSIETRDVAIFAMAKLAESRDHETGAHVERVRNYSQVLARELGQNAEFYAVIDDEFIHLIYLTSPLHDIGKVAIPDAILMKPGRLSSEEFEIMKTHVQHGAQTLDAALSQFPEARFLRMARDITAHHHEWFDGTGYPQGLAGEQIPLCARIVALADVYDALVSRRVYKDACRHEEAVAIIHGESGGHFDPRIVEAFLNVADQFDRIHRQHLDNGSTPPAGEPADQTVTAVGSRR